MRILSMTATFGKLEHQTLALEPGLNVIHAPNEWGKSTWCAFLTAMLYGIDTRERTTAASLADKERYAPWSGAPMTGRIDLEWEGRGITIERSGKGRTPFRSFRAYETGSGLPVPELTAETCGQVLLGVERSVFLRAGFLRLQDLPLTQDEALRRRLNALVTTGDESGAADALTQKLRDLKNRCRSTSKTSLLPQAEARRRELTQALAELDRLHGQEAEISARLEALTQEAADLENHVTALEYQEARLRDQQGKRAEAEARAAEETYQACLARCGALPERQRLRALLAQLEALAQEREALTREANSLPIPGPAPAPFPDPEEAAADLTAWQTATGKKRPLWPLPLGLLCAVLFGVLAWFLAPARVPLAVGAVLALAAGAAGQIWAEREFREARERAHTLEEKYVPLPPEAWLSRAREAETARQAHAQALAADTSARRDLAARQAALADRLSAATGGRDLTECMGACHRALESWSELDRAKGLADQARTYCQTLSALSREAPRPSRPDSRTEDLETTRHLLAENGRERQRLQLRRGSLLGQAEKLGTPSELRAALSQAEARVEKLETYMDALTLAQQTLLDARAELQRRFAPQIAEQARVYFAQLTMGRYDRLTLGEDLSVQSGALGEDTLHDPLWRSDGTADQLYLALRLAVAGALTPHAPLILDDPLVRFDDARFSAAMSLLEELAKERQILYFTCRER